MQSTQHARCPVYLHPAAATSPATVEAIQARTGLLVIISTSQRACLTQPRPAAHSTDDEFGPWGGAA
ncbi:TPA: hypothetical protein ACQTYN_006824 [Pseudomonas aeruginosa]|uniref:hypothetical protein n=1 Tax=Pseudomonas aeruginosa TaxID=287 RepID=UPI00071AFF81|nr:hypothetical protein [Pseudomonas aeruginosa]KSI46190.1 hypothetical protein AO983_28835 [Pseudomonas aeruginosa]MBF2892746.1 hypothetical protein [Pseudomonas aeruginosa]MBF2924883.1 hypothetical protein [Pseudomonas aeruginosa]MBF2938850.1 hypothetical protein [Pseudomonas aeruginosa]MBF2956045.1 hypothetical protein [Pseudomonas aeruginosa]